MSWQKRDILKAPLLQNMKKLKDGYENYSYDIKRLIKKMEAEVLDEEYGF